MTTQQLKAHLEQQLKLAKADPTTPKALVQQMENQLRRLGCEKDNK